MLDSDRIVNPLRVAVGAHHPGGGRGCAMNVISYITGDPAIEDYPKCSALPLSFLVQRLNDRLGMENGHRGLLTAADAAEVLNLGWATVGTGSGQDVIARPWLLWFWRELRSAASEAGRNLVLSDRFSEDEIEKMFINCYVPHSASTAGPASRTVEVFNTALCWSRPGSTRLISHMAGSGVRTWREMAGLPVAAGRAERTRD